VNQRGISTLELMIGSAVLVVSILAASAGVSFYQSMNSVTSRRGDATDFIRFRLAAIKGRITGAGGLRSYVQTLEAAQGLFDPVLKTDLNDPAVFTQQFGFANQDTELLHNVNYHVVFRMTGYRLDATLNPVAVVPGTDLLKDLAFITAVVDLTPDGRPSGGVDAPSARHGEIYIGK
jgi:type II secretory pathway pseudopilin PulG